MIAGELAQSSVYLSNCSTGVRSFGAASALVQYVRKNKDIIREWLCMYKDKFESAS